MKRSTVIFLIFVILWQIAVGLIYGFFLRYDQTNLSTMSTITKFTPQSTSPTSTVYPILNSTNSPFPQAVIAVGIILLIVGLAMIAGYIERSTVTGMAFTLLIFAFTCQNFFIYREFWDRLSVNNPNATANFSGQYYSRINYINYGNSLANSYAYTSASFIDAIGASLAMYAGYTAVIGRIGLGEIFFLTWIGTFLFELNSQLMWRFYFPDNGFPSRAFGFGGALGLVSSLVLGKRQLTINNPHFSTRYRVMGLALLGIVFVWCSFPILTLTSVLESTTGAIVAMIGQVNIWLALAASVLGVFSACSLYYKKFSVHELVFTSITGGIAFSSSTDINYNTGAATAIGFGVGFVCALAQISLKRKINSEGVVDSNSVIFQFLLPSFFAAIFSAISQGVGNTPISYTPVNNSGVAQTAVTYTNLVQAGRNYTSQGGYQIVGWLLSIGIGSVAGLIIGLVYRLINDQQDPKDFFNDAVLYDYPKYDPSGSNQQAHGETKGQNIPQQTPANMAH